MSRSIIIITIFSLLFFIQCGTAISNGMPYSQLTGDVAGTIVPVKEEQVEIQKEKLNIGIKSNKNAFTSNFSTYADVTARYALINNSSSFLEIPVAFPQPGSSRNWEVKLNGEKLALNTEKEIDTSNIDFNNNRRTKWLDPFSGEPYEPEGIYENQSYNNDQVRAQTFHLPLEPGKHRLEVNFNAFTGTDRKRTLNPVFMFQYLLSPAKNWKHFNSLEITIHIPFDHKLKSSIPLERIDSNTWRGDFSSLPEDNLYIYYTPTKGTMGGLIKSHNQALGFLFINTLALYALRRYLFPRLAAGIKIPVDLLLSILIAWRGYITFSITYPGNPLTSIFLFVLLLTILFIPLIIRLHKTLNKSI